MLAMSSVFFSSAAMTAPDENLLKAHAAITETKIAVNINRKAESAMAAVVLMRMNLSLAPVSNRKAQDVRCSDIENACRTAAQRDNKRMRALQWLVVGLSATLLILLSLLIYRQIYKTRRLRILAMTDELTNLPNRQHILTFLGDQAKAAYEGEQPISIIVFEIDNFKLINEQYGHDGGDVALKAVAGVTHQALRRGDKVGRISGEEFLVVLPGTDRLSAIEIAERIRSLIQVIPSDNCPPIQGITISLGVSEWNVGHESIDALVKRADKALKEARIYGRNCLLEK